MEYKLCPGVKIISTPGHTSDDVTVWVETMVSGKSTHFAITGTFTNILSFLMI